MFPKGATGTQELCMPWEEMPIKISTGRLHAQSMDLKLGPWLIRLIPVLGRQGQADF